MLESGSCKAYIDARIRTMMYYESVSVTAVIFILNGMITIAILTVDIDYESSAFGGDWGQLFLKNPLCWEDRFVLRFVLAF